VCWPGATTPILRLVRARPAIIPTPTG